MYIINLELFVGVHCSVVFADWALLDIGHICSIPNLLIPNLRSTRMWVRVEYNRSDKRMCYSFVLDFPQNTA